MTEKTEELSVQLNDAFARLEQEQMTQEDQPDSSTSENPIDESPAGRSSSLGNIVSVLIGLVAVVMASYSVFVVYQQEQASKLKDAANANLEQQIAAIRGTLEQQRLATESADKEIEERLLVQLQDQQKTVQEMATEVSASLADVAQDLGTSGEDWLLAEAEYLIRLGSQRVMMEADPEGAIALYEAADTIVRDAEGVVAFELRQALAADIVSLKGVSDLDVDGLFVKISALINQIDLLKHRQLQYIAVENADPVEEPQNLLARLVQFAASAGDRLSGLVDYRTEGGVVTPILPPKEEYYLRQNLVMKLQLAQLGLLRSDQRIFSASLQETSEWIDRYFDREDGTTKAVQETISAISLVNIEREMPDVSASLREVRKLLARFHEQGKRGTEQ
ncbi:MAG: uroporphyrinogen-III C-methyltransferase [Pseudomonadales bacterium]|nr:uroporphyrinogen-III C-methyltransferase [Pseudomonadales bacterium]MDP6315026.1 uroporphyrinogen-III C-methyltransferase [Pseudomonadales bacterium]MDP7315831.1 uroporphyrinogen-III C-methyltransferase [Pseudomonadales bacterium]MDP7575647.1 uroporphyrinogen-III C-methyltransferase [Pseudomonadales bacterium]HJP51541.1 uroporphyrinogen-III C-methyltransferase [Pseudomonadales bacterium]